MVFDDIPEDRCENPCPAEHACPEWATIRQEYAGRERLFYALARSRPLSYTGVLYGTYIHRSLDA